MLTLSTTIGIIVTAIAIFGFCYLIDVLFDFLRGKSRPTMEKVKSGITFSLLYVIARLVVLFVLKK